MFIKSILVNGKDFDVYTVDDNGDTSEGYDVFDDLGFCVNLGNIFYELPTEETIRNLIN